MAASPYEVAAEPKVAGSWKAEGAVREGAPTTRPLSPLPPCSERSADR